ncbi:putative ribonuclease H-like domain-containing protein [Tanacetum coccineum]
MFFLGGCPTGKLLNTCTVKVDSGTAQGIQRVDIPHNHAFKQTLGLSACTPFNGQKQQRIDLNADALYNEKQENLRVWLLKFLISKKPVPEWPRSSMFKRRLIAADQASVFMATTSDHNRSELGIHDHSNEPSSLKPVPKVFPLAVKTAASRQDLELLFHHQIAMLRTTGINPMIQPEPEDLPKDNPKLEIAVLSEVLRDPTVYRNKKDERGVVVRNKARLVAQGHRQEDGIDYDEVFALVARIEAIRIFLAFASYMGFIVYQIYVKSAFLYGKIDEEVYVSQPPGYLDPKYPQKVYKVVKALYGLHQAPKAWYATLSTFLLKNGYRRGTIDKTLFIKKDKHDIILVQVYVDDIIFGSTKKSCQDKYVAEILKKFDFANVKSASTPIETQKPLVKDEEASDVDVHLYRSMIGSLMYLTASRPDIIFAEIHNMRLSISWQCKKQTIVATSTTKAEYVAAASCCGQNPVYHSKTKHIVIRHHFIRDAYEKKLIQVLKIHTDDNVADLLTKAFDVIAVYKRVRMGFRESLRRVFDGTEALLLPTLFILWLATVSTDSAKLVPLGKVCIAIKTLKKNTAKDTNSLRNLSQIHSYLQALISLLTTITLSTTMAVLDSCPKYNMVAYLEKTKGNVEFHEIIDFLMRSSIHHALTVSLVVSTTFVEQFWTSAKSKIINNVRHITAKVAGKPVSISEASIRSDLLFNNANGIDSLPNQAIFDAIQLMGEVPVEPQTNPSLRPSPSTSIHDSIPESSGGNLGGHSSSDKSLSGNEGEMTLQSVYDLCLFLCAQVSDQAKEIQNLKAQIKKLKKQAKHVVKHHRAWMKSVSLKQRLARKRSSKKQWMHKESVSKQGRKFVKGEPSGHKDPLFNEIPEDTLDYIETEDAQDEGRTRDVVDEEKENTEDVLSIAQQKVSTDKEKVSTNRPIVSTDRSKVSTNRQKDSTDDQNKGTDEQSKGTDEHTKEGRVTQTTQPPTSIIFGDDETIAQVLLNISQAKAVSREKEKGVEFKDIEEIERPRPTSTRSLLTLKPLPKIDPKDKGKKKIEEEDESESESHGIPEAEKKFKQLASDEEMARNVQEEWEGEEERIRLAEEKATNEALIRNYDDIKARIKADILLAEKLQEEEREQFTIEERAKFLHDTIAAQRKFFAQQRSEAIRNRPPTKNQLRNQMMTYLKHENQEV